MLGTSVSPTGKWMPLLDSIAELKEVMVRRHFTGLETSLVSLLSKYVPGGCFGKHAVFLQ